MRHQRGFTLIEVMITLAILGIMAGLAVSYNGSFFRKNRLNQLARGVYSVVSTARAEAVRRSKRVIVSFEDARVIAFIDLSPTPNWKFDDATDTLIMQFRYAEASMASAVDVTTTELSSSVNGVGSVSLMIVFNSRGQSVKVSSANTNEQPAEVGVTFKHTGIPSAQNIFRRISTTAAGAIRVTSR